MMEAPVSVMEFAAYRRRAMELLTSDEQDAVIDLIARKPLAGKLIPGTGGLRKVRIGFDGAGKRGGARVIYYFYNADYPVLLLSLYAKNEKSDLSVQDMKALTAKIAEVIARWTKN